MKQGFFNQLTELYLCVFAVNLYCRFCDKNKFQTHKVFFHNNNYNNLFIKINQRIRNSVCIKIAHFNVP